MDTNGLPPFFVLGSISTTRDLVYPHQYIKSTALGDFILTYITIKGQVSGQLSHITGSFVANYTQPPDLDHITFSKIFTRTSDITFALANQTFIATLDDIFCDFRNFNYITTSVVILASSISTSISGNFYAPYFASIYRVFSNVTSTITANHITPRTGILSKTLNNATSTITLRFIYFYGTLAKTFGNVTSTITANHITPKTGILSKTLNNATSIISAQFLTTLVNFTGLLSDTTSTITGRFYYFQGALESTFINTAVIIRGGIVAKVTFDPTLANVTSILTIRVPIAISVTFTPTLATLQRIFTGKVWPVGTLSRTLANTTVTIRGTLPIPITGTLFNYTYPLQVSWIGRAWPSGHLTRTLTTTTAAFSIKVPVRIDITMNLVTVSIRSTMTIRSPIAGYIAKSLNSIYISWYLKYEMPRRGTLSGILTCSVRIFAKLSTYADLSSTFVTIIPAIYIRVPIRIYTTIALITKLYSGIFVGKVAIGGIFSKTFAMLTGRFNGRVLMGGPFISTFVDCHTQIYIKVPIAITVNLLPTLDSLSMNCRGIGHHRLALMGTLSNVTGFFRMRSSKVSGTMDLTAFTGPTLTVNKFYVGKVGEAYPIRSGRYWKLQIFGNNGDQSITSFAKLKLLALNNSGELFDILASVPDSEDFTANNSEYTTEDGMLWEHTLSTDTEIQAYELEGVE